MVSQGLLQAYAATLTLALIPYAQSSPLIISAPSSSLQRLLTVRHAHSLTFVISRPRIVLGSYSSLRTSQRTKRLLKSIDNKAGKVTQKEDDDEEDDLIERISFSDAYWFPVLGSVMLGGLYLIFKVKRIILSG